MPDHQPAGQMKTSESAALRLFARCSPPASCTRKRRLLRNLTQPSLKFIAIAKFACESTWIPIVTTRMPTSRQAWNSALQGPPPSHSIAGPASCPSSSTAPVEAVRPRDTARSQGDVIVRPACPGSTHAVPGLACLLLAPDMGDSHFARCQLCCRAQSFWNLCCLNSFGARMAVMSRVDHPSSGLFE